MNTDYRYVLDKGSKKFRCPSCGKKRFVKYVDRKKDDYLPEKYGRCDREHSCGYWLNPYEDNFDSIEDDWQDSIYGNSTDREQPDPEFIPYQLFDKSRSRYEKNTFVQFLLKLFNDSIVSELIQKYHIGTSNKINGGCIFYQIDIEGNIRRGKIMVYDSEGHKQRFGSVHNQLGIDKDRYPDWRYFGEHLLTDDKDIPVAIVESEKTAIIASVYFPKYNWIATGTKSTLKAEYCNCLMGRNVTLFPDLGAYEDWQKKADDLSYFCNINTSDLLENIAGAEEKQAGYDLADYLIQFDPKDFQARESDSQTKFDVELNDKGYPKSWDNIQLDEDEPDELQELCERDPIVKKMINMFDGEVKTASEILN